MATKSGYFSIFKILTVAFVSLLCLAIGRIHLRVETTLIGYQLGILKSDESKLLEERSQLKMQLAKLTTKKHLTLMADSGSTKSKKKGSLADVR